MPSGMPGVLRLTLVAAGRAVPGCLVNALDLLAGEAEKAVASGMLAGTRLGIHGIVIADRRLGNRGLEVDASADTQTALALANGLDGGLRSCRHLLSPLVDGKATARSP